MDTLCHFDFGYFLDFVQKVNYINEKSRVGLNTYTLDSLLRHLSSSNIYSGVSNKSVVQINMLEGYFHKI